MPASKSRGQSMVEFAMTLPVFLWLVMGIVDLGRGVVSNSLVANCAREGARAGIYPATSDADILAAINAQSLILGQFTAANVAISPSTQGARTSGGNIAVTVTYTFQPITPLIGSVIGSALTMQSTSTMLIE